MQRTPEKIYITPIPRSSEKSKKSDQSAHSSTSKSVIKRLFAQTGTNENQDLKLTHTKSFSASDFSETNSVVSASAVVSLHNGFCSESMRAHEMWKSQLNRDDALVSEANAARDEQLNLCEMMQRRILGLIEHFCNHRLDPENLFNDESGALEYFRTYLRNTSESEIPGIESDLSIAIELFIESNKKISIRYEMCQIDPLFDGTVRLILFGMKAGADNFGKVSGGSNSFKPHNFVFHCDENLTQILGWNDFVISTHNQIRECELYEKPGFLPFLKLSKTINKRPVRHAFMQVNYGAELSKARFKINKTCDVKRVIRSIWMAFAELTSRTWPNRPVSDIKIENMLIDDSFNVTFIDVYAGEVVSREGHVTNPVTPSKIPMNVYSLVKTLGFEYDDIPLHGFLHPFVSYIQMITAGIEFISKKAISQTSYDEKLGCLGIIDEVLYSERELLERILYFERFYERAKECIRSPDVVFKNSL